MAPPSAAVVGAVLVLQREVELDPVGVVEEEAVGLAVRDREGERDGAVEVVEGGGVPQRRVDVVEDLVGARLLQPARPLAAPEVPFSCLSPLVEPHRTTQGFREDVGPRGLDGAHPELFVVDGELPAGRVGEPDAQGIQRDAGRRRCGRERELLVGLLHGDLDISPVLFGNALRVVPRRTPGGEHPDPKQVGGQGCHFDRRCPGPHPQTPVVMVEQLRGAERLVVAPCLGLLLEGLGQCSSLRSEAGQHGACAFHQRLTGACQHSAIWLRLAFYMTTLLCLLLSLRLRRRLRRRRLGLRRGRGRSRGPSVRRGTR